MPSFSVILVGAALGALSGSWAVRALFPGVLERLSPYGADTFFWGAAVILLLGFLLGYVGRVQNFFWKISAATITGVSGVFLLAALLMRKDRFWLFFPAHWNLIALLCFIFFSVCGLALLGRRGRNLSQSDFSLSALAAAGAALLVLFPWFYEKLH